VKKLTTALALLSIFLGVLAVLVEYSGSDRIVVGGIKLLTGQMFLLVVFFATIAIILKLSSNSETPQRPSDDTRTLCWITGVIVLAMVALLNLGARKWLSPNEIVEEFQKVYFAEERLKTTFLGIASLQYPTDNWTMQEIISEIKPDVVVETGTNAGGTALFYATILERVNDQGRVITVDVAEQDPRVVQLPIWQQRVEAIRGSSVSDDVLEKIRARVRGLKVLVTLDSLHTKEHVLKEMQLYSPLVSLNSYLVVQDTQLMGHPIPLRMYTHEGHEGPFEAVQEFLAGNKNFVVDRQRERFLLTANPSGFLKRVK
jgi:cephalosporin hydroxylase